MIDPDQSTLREAWMAIAQLEQLRGDVAELAKNIGLAADTAPLLVFGAARNIISSFRIYHPEHAAAELRLAVRTLTPPKEPATSLRFIIQRLGWDDVNGETWRSFPENGPPMSFEEAKESVGIFARSDPSEKYRVTAVTTEGVPR